MNTEKQFLLLISFIYLWSRMFWFKTQHSFWETIVFCVIKVECKALVIILFICYCGSSLQVWLYAFFCGVMLMITASVNWDKLILVFTATLSKFLLACFYYASIHSLYVFWCFDYAVRHSNLTAFTSLCYRESFQSSSSIMCHQVKTMCHWTELGGALWCWTDVTSSCRTTPAVKIYIFSKHKTSRGITSKHCVTCRAGVMTSSLDFSTSDLKSASATLLKKFR